jgi:hypothetical protein
VAPEVGATGRKRRATQLLHCNDRACRGRLPMRVGNPDIARVSSPDMFDHPTISRGKTSSSVAWGRVL